MLCIPYVPSHPSRRNQRHMAYTRFDLPLSSDLQGILHTGLMRRHPSLPDPRGSHHSYLIQLEHMLQRGTCDQ